MLALKYEVECGERTVGAECLEENVMSEPSKRNEWDEHNRDEAKELATQQQSAGPTHRPVPVEPYVSVGGSQAHAGAIRYVGALTETYERATAAERLAWLALRNSLADDRSSSEREPVARRSGEHPASCARTRRQLNGLLAGLLHILNRAVQDRSSADFSELSRITVFRVRHVAIKLSTGSKWIKGDFR